jgi:TonB-linked SusC/RagA family outer membrane protein
MHSLWRSLALLAGLLIIGPVRPGVLGAQQPVTITGRVTNDAGAPLSLASVYIETLGVGSQTAADGRYQLTVPAARVHGQQVSLGVRAIGFRNTSTLITLTGGALTQDFTLAANPLRLGEVVITGSGTSTTVEKLGNTINSVKSEDVRKSNEANIVNALAAKAPGVEVTSQSGDPGAGSSIIIRGLKTIQGDGQPLFVIDGQPIDNSTLKTGDFADAGTAYSNRAADINPNDIESIEILKGAAASAIYGARAAQGVVLITTKSGRAGQTRYTYRSSFGWDDVNKSIPLQRNYGRGQEGSAALAACAGLGCYPTASSWGPKLEGSTKTFDHWNEAFSTGRTYDNVLDVSGGDDRRTFYASLGNTYQNGTIVGDNDKYSRTTARLKATQFFGSNLRVGGNIAYMDVRARYIQKGNNLNGILLGLARTPPDFDNFPYVVDGLHRSYRYPNPDPADPLADRVYDNPFWVINRDQNTSDVNRAIGNFDVSWDALNWLNLKYTFGADYSADNRIEGLPPQSAGDALTGQLWQGTYSNLQLDGNFVATAQKKWSDALNTTFTLGQNLNSRDLRQVQSKGTTYIDPTLFTLNNTVNSNMQAQNYSSLVRVAGYFAQAGVDLWNQMYLTAAVRADQSSTFPKEDRTNYYPKASLAWNAFGTGSRGAVGPLSYLKLRAAYGAVGREPLAYQILDAFSNGAIPLDFGGGSTSPTQSGKGGLVSDTVKGAPTLKPERTSEFEGGFDFGLFNQRVDGGVTLYNAKTTDVIFFTPVAVSTGFKNVTSNGGEITNKGLEISLNGRALEGQRLRWEIGVNWATNTNKLTQLQGADYVGLTGGFGNSLAVKGEPLGTFYGTDWVRCRYGVADADNVQSTSLGESTDINALCRAANAPNGSLFVDANGFPLLDPANRVLGDPNPDWISGIRNTFTLYKKLQLSALVDVKKGGVNWNGTRLALQRFGTIGNTAVRADCSAGVAACTGNEKVFGRSIEKSPGVVGPGKDKSVPIGENWWRAGLGNNFNGPTGQGVEDAGYVKLREISATYTWENARVRNLTGFTAIEFRLAARNLHTWSDYSGVDPETNLEGSFGIGRGQDYFNNPQTRSLIFTINLSH